MNTFNIAYLTFLEGRNRRMFWAVALLALSFQVLFGIGFTFLHSEVGGQSLPLGEFTEFNNVFLLLGLYAVNFMVVALSILVSVDTISGEIQSGTIHTIVTKPLRRWQVIIGKWLGLGLMLTLFTLLMSLTTVLIVYLVSGFLPMHLLQGLALMVLEALVLLTVSFIGGTRLSTLTNGVVVFMLHGIAFVGSWIEQAGSVASNQVPTQIGVITSLILPSEVLWRRLTYIMQPPLLSTLGVGPFVTVSAPTTAAVVYAGLYVLAGLGLALLFFQRRDL